MSLGYIAFTRCRQVKLDQHGGSPLLHCQTFQILKLLKLNTILGVARFRHQSPEFFFERRFYNLSLNIDQFRRILLSSWPTQVF